MKKTKARPLPATTIRTLLTLSLPGARLLLCSGECYVLSKLTSKHVTAKVYDALYEAGWIGSPQARGADIAECSITGDGRRFAERIRAQGNMYCQLHLFTDTALAF